MYSSTILTEDQKQALLTLLKETSSVFWGPDQQKCVGLLQESFFDPFEKINAIPGFQISKALNEISSILEKFVQADALYQHLEQAYVRLFISNRKGVLAPLYEFCYAGSKQDEKALLMGRSAADMKKRFMSKGLSVSKEIHEPPDQLSIELEYLYFLLAKGWSDGDITLISEASVFASETILPWTLKLHNGSLLKPNAASVRESIPGRPAFGHQPCDRLEPHEKK